MVGQILNDKPNQIHNSNTMWGGGSGTRLVTGQTMKDRPNLIHNSDTRWGGGSGARMLKQ